MTNRARRRGVAMILGVLLLAACGGDDAGDGEPRPLTEEQANALANALFDNYDRGGATFQLAAQLGPGAALNMQGEVDWQGHRGHALVVGRGVESGVTEVYWDETGVLERRPALTALLEQAGMPGVEYVARAADVEGRALDQLIATVTGLASEQRDNPQLIRQTEGSGWLRDDELRGEAVQVLRFGELTTYWLTTEGSRMLRFEGDNSIGSRPIVFDVVEPGAQDISIPAGAGIVAAEEIQEFYESALEADSR